MSRSIPDHETLDLPASPSMRFNNLSISSTLQAAFTDKKAVVVVPLPGNVADPIHKVNVRNASVIMQARFIDIKGREYLAIGSDIGVHLYDCANAAIASEFFIEDIPGCGSVEESSSRMKYCCGLNGMSMSPFLLVGTSWGSIAVLHLDRKAKRLSLDRVLHGRPSAICAIDSTLSHVVAGDEAGQVTLWNADTFQVISDFPRMGHPCSGVRIRGDTVVAAFTLGVVRMYDLTLGRMTHEVDAHCRTLSALEMHPTRGAFATVGEDGSVALWEFDSRDKRNEIRVTFSKYLKDQLLVGCAFTKEKSPQLAVSSYQEPKLDRFIRV